MPHEMRSSPAGHKKTHIWGLTVKVCICEAVREQIIGSIVICFFVSESKTMFEARWNSPQPYIPSARAHTKLIFSNLFLVLPADFLPLRDRLSHLQDHLEETAYILTSPGRKQMSGLEHVPWTSMSNPWQVHEGRESELRHG